MIKANHDKLMNIADVTNEELNKWYSEMLSKSYLVRIRNYTKVKCHDLLEEEECEVAKLFTNKNRPWESWFATKITDNIYIVENIYCMTVNGKREHKHYFVPYLKSIPETKKGVLYYSFEQAVIAAICLQNNLSQEQINVINQMISCLGKTNE